MNRIITIGVILCSVVLGGCQTPAEFFGSFQESAAKIEAKAAVVIAKIRAKYPVVLAEAQQTAAEACGLVPTLRTSLATFTGSIQNPSAKVQAYIETANRHAGIAAAACDSYLAAYNSPAPPTLSQTLNFGLQIWNAYQAGKIAYQQAAAGP